MATGARSGRADPTRASRKIRGVELATRELGAGLPFVWAHGLLSSMEQEDAVGLFDWSPAAAHVRWIRYDARGHGASGASDDPADYRGPALARDMLALADAEGAARAVLGGLSMGCATALHAAVSDPDRVAGLVLVAPPTAWETRPRQARFYRLASGLVAFLGLAPFRRLASLPGPGRASPVVAALQRTLVAHLARADARSVSAALRGAAESDLPAPAALRRLAMPALLLAWRGDPVHPLSTAERLSELLPQAELHVARSLDELRGWPALVARLAARVARAAAEGGP